MINLGGGTRKAVQASDREIREWKKKKMLRNVTLRDDLNTNEKKLRNVHARVQYIPSFPPDHQWTAPRCYYIEFGTDGTYDTYIILSYL